MNLISLEKRVTELEKSIPIFMDDIDVKAFSVCSDAELDAIQQMRELALDGLLKDDIHDRMGTESFNLAVNALERVSTERVRLVEEAGTRLRVCNKCHR